MKKFGTVIILAGGKSSRMGFDKQFLKIEQRSLMDSMIHKLSKEFDEIIIVTNKPEHYIGLGHKITKDIIEDMGPLSGIHAGLTICSSQYALIVACDMPNINMEYIRYMKTQVGNHGCTTKLGNYLEPFISYYSKDVIVDIEEYLATNKRSIHGFLPSIGFSYIEENIARKFSPNWDMFLNLNTKDDLNDFLSKGGDNINEFN